jgi:hypothetical protein
MYTNLGKTIAMHVIFGAQLLGIEVSNGKPMPDALLECYF